VLEFAGMSRQGMSMTVDTLEYVKRLEAAGVPRAQAEAHATVLRDEIATHLVTNTDLGAAVDRVEGKIEAEVSRLEGKIDRLDDKIDASLVRVENTMWKAGFAMLGGSLAIGGLLLRFMR
jgi:predicted ribosome quality control (RQC) complex YloA/Tae2 family protein